MKQPVHVEYGADGQWQSTGIDYADYARMQVQTHKVAPWRRLETPSWAVNDSQLRKLLVAFMEERAFYRAGLQTGTLTERLANAQKKIIADCSELTKTLDRLCARFVELKRTIPFTPEIAKQATKLAQQIETLDTRLRFEAKDGGVALLCGVIYKYYRLGMDSVGVGKELGIKPPHCRQIIWRLSKTWEKLHPEFTKPKPTGRHLVARRKHVAIAEKLAAENGGCIPASRWMHANGYEATYDFLRQHSEAFEHLKRSSRAPSEKPVRIKSLAEKQVEQERSAQIIAMYQSGASIRRIAEELRCSFAPVCRALKGAGVIRRRGRARLVTPEAEQALAMYKSGLKPARIAEALGIKSMWRMHRVRRLLKAVGVDLPRQRMLNEQWNSAQREQIVALYESGSTVLAITAQFGYVHRIRLLLNAAGIYQPHRDKFRKPNQIKPIKSRAAFQEQVLAYYKDGMAIADVAVHFGYLRGSGCNRVRDVLVRAGLYQLKQKPRQGGAAVAESFVGSVNSDESAPHPAR